MNGLVQKKRFLDRELPGTYRKLGREDVAELSSVSVPSSGDFLVFIVEVGRGEEMSEDHGGDVHLLVFVHHHGNSLAIVVHLKRKKKKKRLFRTKLFSNNYPVDTWRKEELIIIGTATAAAVSP